MNAEIFDRLFYVVNYISDSIYHVVQRSWLFEIKSNYPYDTLVFYNPRNSNCHISHSDLLLLEDRTNEIKSPGRSYMARVIDGFGKNIV